jgi:hypothetical protein
MTSVDTSWLLISTFWSLTLEGICSDVTEKLLEQLFHHTNTRETFGKQKVRDLPTSISPGATPYTIGMSKEHSTHSTSRKQGMPVTMYETNSD